MKLLLDNWRQYLTEATDLLQSQNDNVSIFADWAKGHIERGHKEPGKGSSLAEFDLGQVADAIAVSDVNPDQAVTVQSELPNVGYILGAPNERGASPPRCRAHNCHEGGARRRSHSPRRRHFRTPG
jgi:hypothetical protein